MLRDGCVGFAQLTIRDAEGESYLPLQILLQEEKYEPHLHKAVLQVAPREALINDSVWRVSIAFVSSTEAPVT